ncbi:serine O-acetyltransferase [Vibrio astriarenae]
MKLSDCWEYIRSDAYRYSGQVNNINMLKLYFKNPFFKFCFWFRLSKCNLWGLCVISKFFKALVGRTTNIQIHKSVQIGYGLFIPHGNVVVNSTASIGDNATLCQFSTIGSVSSNAATIGNNVYVGPAVCIVENVTIGDNAILGAGCVVTKSILSESVVAGVPAKKISNVDLDTVGFYTYNYFFGNARKV